MCKQRCIRICGRCVACQDLCARTDVGRRDRNGRNYLINSCLFCCAFGGENFDVKFDFVVGLCSACLPDVAEVLRFRKINAFLDRSCVEMARFAYLATFCGMQCCRVCHCYERIYITDGYFRVELTMVWKRWWNYLFDYFSNERACF